MRKSPTTFVSVSAGKFQDPDARWVYRFPIESPLHPNYGRMTISLEAIVKNNKIAKLYLCFGQHDTQMLRPNFEILTPQADRFTSIVSNGCSRLSFLGSVWQVNWCREHKCAMLNAYVPNGVKALVVQTLTSSISINYE